MSAIPTMHIPIVVNTEQVAPAMKKVEKTITDSAQRIGKLKSAALPALGALGAGPLGGILSGVSGMGGAGLAASGAVAAFAAPIMAARMLESALRETTNGATQALDEYKKTGTQTFAVNSALLERLSNLEKGLKTPTMGFTGSFAQANAANSEQGFGIAEWWSRTFTEMGAGLGAFAATGDVKTSMLEAQLSTAGEGVAKQIAAELAKLSLVRSQEESMMNQAIAGGTVIDPDGKQLEREQANLLRLLAKGIY